MLMNTPAPAPRSDIRHALHHVRRGIETVTPVDAEQSLERIFGGKLNKGSNYLRKIKGYSDQMARRLWVLNGDTLIYDEDGNLVDGEARMRACILSGEPFRTFVIRGIKKEAVPTLQSGISRSGSDALTISGEPLAREIAGAWPIIGGYLRMLGGGGSFDQTDPSIMRPDVILALTDKFPDVHASAEKVQSLKSKLGPLGTGLATGFHYLSSRVDPALADRFLDAFSQPNGPEDRPAVALRKMLTAGERFRQERKLASAIKAFNCLSQGTGVPSRGLGWDPKGNGQDAGETFPRLVGFPRHPALFEDAKALKRNLRSSTRSEDAEIEVRIVTPAECHEFLKLNGPIGSAGNRKVRNNKVASIGRDMLNQRYFYNGQALKFGRSGRLLDGQHRCLACIATGIPFITAIITGLDDDVFATLDGGGRKGGNHYLRANGVKDSSMFGAAINLYNKAVTGKRFAPTNLELLDEADRHVALRELMADPAKVKLLRSTGMPLSVGWALYYMTHSVNPEGADAFFARVADAVDYAGSPAIRLSLLMKDMKNAKGQNPVADKILMEAMTAWNLWREGASVTRLPDVSTYPKILA